MEVERSKEPGKYHKRKRMKEGRGKRVEGKKEGKRKKKLKKEDN